ncbi:pilus assembly protein PilW [Noviherbaspirillum cavernae]|uniref:Pilus assembly protein PilW n=1 Tax=Noviherbaspirillum cavernae TaxID=2320862 RepID=A0A418X6P8_9BURK|nr:pilus assembly protein PilW [Noviherbaspirillum cavernae]
MTLVELMISMTLGLVVVMAATALLLSTKSGYAVQDESARIQDTGRYAIESIARAVRQAAYEDWRTDDVPILSTGDISANIEGLDAKSLKKITAGIESPQSDAVNGSDVLAVRFFGSGIGKHGDGTIINCAGFGVRAATSQATAESERGWSIFYVRTGTDGEPGLYCKWKKDAEPGAGGDDSWTAESIARGVESFQVLYGLDLNADSLPDRFVSATAINAMDDAFVAAAGAAENPVDKNKITNWKKVVTVKVALLLRGSQPTREGTPNLVYDLFGKDYADANATTDIGTRIKEMALPNSIRNRARKAFAMSIQLRNQAAGSGA